MIMIAIRARKEALDQRDSDERRSYFYYSFKLYIYSVE